MNWDMVSTLEKIELLKGGKLTCVENTQNFLDIIKSENENYNIVLGVNDGAISRAKELDEKRERGENLGELFGLCFLVKSNISVLGQTTSCASKVLEDYKASFNADVIEKLLREDAIVLGSANNDEFACGSAGEHSAFGPTINPVTPSRVPGGTSSGSAAAIAANFCDVALGSDTGGSCRNPASHCGIVGIKPSYGRVSRYGLVDSSMSFDQIGILAPDVEISALVLECIAGESENDATTVSAPVDSYSSDSTKTYKIGYIPEFTNMIIDSRIKDLFSKKLKEVEKKGHQVVELQFKHIDLAVQSYYPIQYTEFSSGMRKFDGIKYGTQALEDAGEEVLRRIYGGREISKAEFDGAYYKKALRVREILKAEFLSAFEEVDFILTPVTPNLPHKLGSIQSADEEYAIDAFTTPPSLIGICGGVVSKDVIEEGDEKVMIGTQVLANFNDEKALFSGLRILENL